MNLIKRISPFARFVVIINTFIIVLSLTKVIKPPAKTFANDYKSTLARIVPDTVEWNHFKDRLGFPAYDRFSKMWITPADTASDSTLLILLSFHAVRLFSFDSLSKQYPHWNPVPLRSLYLSNDHWRIHDTDYTDCQLIYPVLFFMHPSKGQILSLNLETYKNKSYKGKPFHVFSAASETVVIREPDAYYFFHLSDYPSDKNPFIRVPADSGTTLSHGQNAVIFSEDGRYVALAHTIPVGQQGLYGYESGLMKLLYSFDCVDCEQVFISPHANRLLIRDKGILEYRLLEYEATTGQYINRHQLKPGAFIETCIWNETGDAFFVKSAAGQIVFILSGEKITAFSNAEYDWIDAIDGSFSNRSLFLIRNTEATTGYDPILRRNIKCDQTLIYRMPLP